MTVCTRGVQLAELALEYIVKLKMKGLTPTTIYISPDDYKELKSAEAASVLRRGDPSHSATPTTKSPNTTASLWGLPVVVLPEINDLMVAT